MYDIFEIKMLRMKTVFLWCFVAGACSLVARLLTQKKQKAYGFNLLRDVSKAAFAMEFHMSNGDMPVAARKKKPCPIIGHGFF